MGGAIGGGFTDAVFSSDGVGAGNVTKWAEFNVWVRLSIFILLDIS